ncbi:hypothetical protein [Rubrivivax gelatinosus]|uniref:hypothetical protein n=1 Tax=Rubrivivax gelatinosus TaxID=28068 RepID=UPI0012FD9A08|nr:hypothetical protein [Rubrivivax gelatinosus]MBG6083130.1 hypothetical protein [Rubrivivax gelatinosus]
MTVIESGLHNVPAPRRFLVDVAHIASVEDLSGNPHARIHVTLFEAADATVESDDGEHVARGSKGLLALDSYEDIKAQLATIDEVVSSKCAVESTLASAKGR